MIALLVLSIVSVALAHLVQRVLRISDNATGWIGIGIVLLLSIATEQVAR